MKKSNDTGRTVREVVEHNPESISEVWCRKVFRELLRLLEKQYALQSPHRAITPDTVLIHDDGSLSLLPSLLDDSMPGLAADLTALARIVHYAITREIVPTGPLYGRAPDGFSASLVNAVDRCMAFDPARRPRTIGDLRDLLGIVVFRPAPSTRQAAPAAAKQASAAPAARPKQAAPSKPMRRRHWIEAGTGLAIVSSVGFAVFAGLRGAPAPDRPALAPPASRDAVGARPGTRAAPATDAGAPAAGTRPGSGAGEAASATVQAEAGRADTAAGMAPAAVTENPAAQVHGKSVASPGNRRAPIAPVPAAPPRNTAADKPVAASAPSTPSAATAASTTTNTESGAVFTLHIQPWGKVYVDGRARGISPPVKRLELAPGRHAVLVTNPAGGERALEVDTARGDGRIAVDFENGQ